MTRIVGVGFSIFDGGFVLGRNATESHSGLV